MYSHFLFEPGSWKGAGSVAFSFSPDVMYFKSAWQIAQQDDSTTICTQVVEIVGGEAMTNVFIVKRKDNESFDITLNNELLGSFLGSGVIEEKIVAWEFTHKGALEGMEVFTKVYDDEYQMRAEYLSDDGQRTQIRGKLWCGESRDQQE